MNSNSLQVFSLIQFEQFQQNHDQREPWANPTEYVHVYYNTCTIDDWNTD